MKDFYIFLLIYNEFFIIIVSEKQMITSLLMYTRKLLLKLALIVRYFIC